MRNILSIAILIVSVLLIMFLLLKPGSDTERKVDQYINAYYYRLFFFCSFAFISFAYGHTSFAYGHTIYISSTDDTDIIYVDDAYFGSGKCTKIPYSDNMHYAYTDKNGNYFSFDFAESPSVVNGYAPRYHTDTILTPLAREKWQQSYPMQLIGDMLRKKYAQEFRREKVHTFVENILKQAKD